MRNSDHLLSLRESALNNNDSNDEIKKLETNKNNAEIKVNSYKKLALIQIILLLLLVGIFLVHIFEITDFLGFCIIVIGVDIWLIKSISSGKNQCNNHDSSSYGHS